MRNHHQQHHHFHQQAHKEHMKGHHGFMFDFDDLFSDSFDLFGDGDEDPFGSLMGNSFHQESNLKKIVKKNTNFYFFK